MTAAGLHAQPVTAAAPYPLGLDDGATVRLRQPSHHLGHRDLPVPGGRIDLLLHPEDTVIVPADDQPAAGAAGALQG